MRIAVAMRLSEPQNLVFERSLERVGRTVGLGIETAADPEVADLVYLCGLPATKLAETHIPVLAPVLPMERYQQRPWYFVDVVSSKESRGLGTGRWAYNHRESFSGWVAVRHGLRVNHVDPDTLSWTSTGSHAASLEAVRIGFVDLAGIDSMIIDLSPGLAGGIGVIDSWGPWPTPPVMARRSLDKDLLSDLVDSFAGTVDGVKWVSIDDDHLDPIRAVSADQLLES